MYQIGSLVEMKKPHACTIKATGKKANEWEVTRLGADIKIRCTNCDHVVMMGRHAVSYTHLVLREIAFPQLLRQ